MVSNPDWRSEREAKLEALQERLTTAVEGLVTGEDWIRAMTFATQFRSRSFASTLLIYAQHAERYEAGSTRRHRQGQGWNIEHLGLLGAIAPRQQLRWPRPIKQACWRSTFLAVASQAASLASPLARLRDKPPSI